MESIPLVQFSPFCHDIATLYPSYEKILDPNKKIDWMDPDKELNLKLYRSDEFSKDHGSKKHILFSGCSVTYGTGLLLEETWTRQLWQTLQDTSGYFNLAMEGNNISNMVFEIIKYCSIYGNPNTIVLNLPDPYRSMQPMPGGSTNFIFDRPKFDNKKNMPLDSETELLKAKLELAVFQSYKVLELYCKSHNIELYSFSWDMKTEDLFGSPDFPTFFKIDQGWLAAAMVEYLELNPDKEEFSIYARDQAKHPGTAYHYAYFKFIKQIINNAI